MDVGLDVCEVVPLVELVIVVDGVVLAVVLDVGVVVMVVLVVAVVDGEVVGDVVAVVLTHTLASSRPCTLRVTTAP